MRGARMQLCVSNLRRRAAGAWPQRHGSGYTPALGYWTGQRLLRRFVSLTFMRSNRLKRLSLMTGGYAGAGDVSFEGASSQTATDFPYLMVPLCERSEDRARRLGRAGQ